MNENVSKSNPQEMPKDKDDQLTEKFNAKVAEAACVDYNNKAERDFINEHFCIINCF